MKHKEGILLLLALLLVVSSALAQTGDSQGTTDLPNADLPNKDLPRQVALARCAYDATEDVCASMNRPSPEARDASGDTTLAQDPQRIPGPPAHPRPPMGRPRPAFPGMWREEGNPRHAAIGALIGFGLGAALGAHANRDQHPGVGVRAAFLVGSIGAVLGAAVGYSTPPIRARRPYRRGPWPDEDAMASRSKPASSEDSVGQKSTQTDELEPSPSRPATTADAPDPYAASAR